MDPAALETAQEPASHLPVRSIPHTPPILASDHNTAFPVLGWAIATNVTSLQVVRSTGSVAAA